MTLARLYDVSGFEADPTLPVAEAPSNKRIKPKFRVKILPVILLVLVLSLVWNIVRMHLTIWDLERQIEAEIQRKEQLEAYEQELQHNLKQVQSGDYIEKLAREELGLVKPGESLVITQKSSENINN